MFNFPEPKVTSANGVFVYQSKNPKLFREKNLFF